MIQIILNEWKILLRVKVLAYLSLFFVISLSVVTYLGIVQNSRQQQQQLAAKEHVRQQWENIDAMNPHSAAHYGSYAFKAINALSSIDEGVNTITGNVLRLEGHVQNEMLYSEASQSLSVSKFGKLKPSLLLQYVIPLLLIFPAFASVSAERESGRLKLLVFQGVSLRQLIFSKAFSIWLYGLLLLLITIAVQIIANAANTIMHDAGRITLIILSYAAYYYIIVVLAAGISAWLHNNTAALSSLLAIWMLWTIFLPRIWGNTVEKIHPLPSRQAFKAAMREDRSKGIDGHNPSDKREEKLKQKILEEYGVDSVDQLPINFDGIVMQEDEEYGNQVWDKHFGQNYQILQRQKKAYQLSGFLNPFASLQSAGMGLSGSDMLHHLDFLKQAEQYRRHLIKSLNDKHAYGGSRTGDWGWKAERDFYQSIEDFHYEIPSANSVATHYRLDFICLAFWGAMVTLAVLFFSGKIELIR